MIKRYAIAVGVTFGAALLAVVFLSVVSLKMGDPRKFADVFGIIAFMTGCMAAGFTFKITEDHPVISAALCSFVYIAAIMTVSLFFRNESTRPIVQSAVIYIIGLAVSTVIGLLFAVKKTGSKKARKNMMKKLSGR
ncbi:MAG: hypothetical protein HFE78_01180 [Clostridiales bacterium]|nr:hypothetical protein [Clostridiales bacterium]